MASAEEWLMGCRDCKHRYSRAGESMCDIEPHDFVTLEQRAVVRWLSSTRDPFRDGGCPSHEREVSRAG